MRKGVLEKTLSETKPRCWTLLEISVGHMLAAGYNLDMANGLFLYCAENVQFSAPSKEQKTKTSKET